MHRFACMALLLLLSGLTWPTLASPAQDTRPVIRVGFYDFPPYSYEDRQGRAQGSLLALTQRLLEQAGYRAELRMLPGIYWHRITEAAGKRFFEDTWKVAPEADRIGYRFKGGSALSFQPREQPFGAGSDPSNIVDSCYPIGSIQVPAGLEPIVLHRDAVSGGGYAMIGTVISADLDLIGQMQPNQKARFVAVTLEEALEARRSYKKKLSCLSKLFPS